MAKNDFVKTWFDLIKRGNRYRHAVARLLHKVWREVAQQDEHKFLFFVTNKFLETSAQARVDLLLAKAYAHVQSEEAWLKLGEAGIILLTHNVPEANRDAFMHDAMARATKHGALGTEQIESLRAKWVPVVERARSTRPHPGTELAVLKAEFAKILKRHPEIADELSEEAREALKDVITAVEA